MYQYFSHEGPAVTAGALTFRTEWSGELEPLDRTDDREAPGVYGNDGSCFFEFNGIEYSIPFGAAFWLEHDGRMVFENFNDGEPMWAFDLDKGENREATADEVAAVEKAAGGVSAFWIAAGGAQAACVRTMSDKVRPFIEKCVEEGEA